MRRHPAPFLFPLATILFAALAAAAPTAPESRVLEALEPARALQDIERLSRSADGTPQGVGEGSVVSGSRRSARSRPDSPVAWKIWASTYARNPTRCGRTVTAFRHSRLQVSALRR